MRSGLVFSALVLLAATSGLAKADTYTYTFTGAPFSGPFSSAPAPFTPSDSITGSLTLAAPLATGPQSVTPLSFSFSDGVDTFTNATASFANFFFDANSAGQIDLWQIYLGSDTANQIYTDAGSEIVFHNGVRAYDIGPTSKGTWTETVNASSTPEPSGLVLVATGTLGCVGVIRRRAGRKDDGNVRQTA